MPVVDARTALPLWAVAGLFGHEAAPLLSILVDPKQRLTLEECRRHCWAALPGGILDGGGHFAPVDESHVREERIRLPVQPSKQQVEQLRRDLHIWMKTFKCSAQLKQMDVIAQLDPQALDGRCVEDARHELHLIVQHHFGSAAVARPAPRGREPALATVPERPEKRSFRLLTFVLHVHEEHGAGLDLQPERGGMRIEKIYSKPGQPGLQPKDLITKINEVSLRGTPQTVEEVFGAHFGDGAQLAIKREI